MPTYDYECQACGHTFEVSQRITEKSLTDCPQCKEPKLQRLITAAAFHLKGGGWYKDGYGKGGSSRTENQRIDKLQQKVNESKAADSDSSGSTSTSDSSSGPSSGSGGSGSGGSST
ncbi:MAG TPA: zinc ribbon domain-containing protein [Pseudomonadota bacterium]|jgi:putative FmdB family regulatory protein|nr:zinc ribbon domain-containing protein [Pseudomonadota bacterium]